MLTVLAEGPGWAAINKPAGIATERHFQYDTVEGRALECWKRPGATKPPYVGIVHRLDRVTSGALVLARRKSTLVRLNESFARGRTQKVYRAVTSAPLPAEHGELRHYLVRNPTNKRAVANVRPVPGGKEAVLDYRLLRSGNGRFEYEIRPRTGRFHQIRAQLAATGAPIVGDADYGSKVILGEARIALHAAVLSFPDPNDDATIEVTAELPDYWPLTL